MQKIVINEPSVKGKIFEPFPLTVYNTEDRAVFFTKIISVEILKKTMNFIKSIFNNNHYIIRHYEV